MEICPAFGFDLHDMPSKSSSIQPIKTYSSLKATSPQALKKYGTLNKKFKRLRINYPETSSLALKKIITRLPYLERVIVIFTDFDPKFESKTKFLQAFFRSFNRLKHLNFDFGWCDRISNKSLLFLRPALYKLPGLTKLEINFEWCSNLSEASINSVWKGIAKLKNLENIVLKLTGCDKVSDKSVRCLRNSIVNLRNLKRICLELKRCLNVTDEGLQILLDGVIKIRALQSLTIDLEDSHKIYDLNLLESQKKREKTHKMQIVGLNFMECFRIFELGLELPWVEDIWANSSFFRKLAFNLRGKDFIQKSYAAHLQRKLFSCNSEFETQVLSLL